MTDLRRLLQGVAPEPDELDVAAVRGRARQLDQRRKRAVAGGAVAAVVLAAGVVLTLPGSAPQEVLAPASPGPVVTTTRPAPTASPSGSPSPAFRADTRPDTATGRGRLLAVTGIRVAAQDGFDRVVLDLAGDPGATPGWRVEYVDQPVADGSGAPLAVRGTAYLRVVVLGVDVTDPVAQQQAYAGGPVTPSGTTLVRQVVPAGAFEGQSSVVIGTSGRLPFRVFALSSPTRIVVDVRR